MNSTATAIVTDFLRPWSVCRNESGYLAAARGLTFTFGVAGTLLGLLFVNPEIKSLFDAFIKVIGLFMGVLGRSLCPGRDDPACKRIRRADRCLVWDGSDVQLVALYGRYRVPVHV